MARLSLDGYPVNVRVLAVGARNLILHALPRSIETYDETAGVVGFGYGAGHKGIICTLILSKSGVKLGIAHGAELPDPDGLLKGAGTTHRHIQLRAPSDIRKPAVARLLKAAKAAWQERTG